MANGSHTLNDIIYWYCSEYRNYNEISIVKISSSYLHNSQDHYHVFVRADHKKPCYNYNTGIVQRTCVMDIDLNFCFNNAKQIGNLYSYSPVPVTGGKICGEGLTYNSVKDRCYSENLDQYKKPLEKQKGAPTCPVGNPCDAASGNKYQAEVDFNLNIKHIPSFIRYYNSLDSLYKASDGTGVYLANFNLGHGWSSNITNHVLDINTGNNTIYAMRGDGKGFVFTKDDNNWSADIDVRLNLVENTDGYTITDANGVIESYNTTGKLLQTHSKTDKTTIYAYNSNNLIENITGHYGHTLSFSYNDNNQLTTLTTSNSQVYAYAYDANNNLVGVTYPDGSTKTYHYENSSLPHHLTGITSGDGVRFATYVYSSNGFAISTEHATTTNTSPQEKITLNYDSYAHTVLTDAKGTQEVITFIEQHNSKKPISKINKTDNKGWLQEFDANNNLIKRTDSEGNITTYGYNEHNQMLQKIEGFGTDDTRTITYEYLNITTKNLYTKITTFSVYANNNKKILITYNTNNQPTQITEQGFNVLGNNISRIINISYNNKAQLISIYGPRINIADLTTFTYYDCTTGAGCGQLKTMTNALGHTITLDSYNTNGQPTKQTSANGLITTYGYDDNARLVSINTTDGVSTQTSSYTYNINGLLSQTIEGTQTLNYKYNAAHDLVKISDNLDNYISYSYDIKGNQITQNIYDPSNILTQQLQHKYDMRDKVSQINSGGIITNLTYNTIGELTQITNGKGSSQNFTYDALMRNTQVTNADNNNIINAYDTHNNLTQVTDLNGNIITYTYDDLGNLTKQISPDTGTTTYSYDSAGNQLTKTNAKSITSTYSYDALNRLINISYPNTVLNANFSYDDDTNRANAIGRLNRSVDSSGTTNYRYDKYGNITNTTHTIDSYNFITNYQYNANNDITHITYPSGIIVDYVYNNIGKVIEIGLTNINKSRKILAKSITYQPFGPVKSYTLGNGLVQTNTFDLGYKLNTLTTKGVLDKNYSYDLNANIESISTASPALQSFNYDTLDRLISANGNYGDISYGYDANHNRLTKSILADNNKEQKLNYQSINNHINTISTVNSATSTLSTYQYDAIGNIINNGKFSFDYTDNNRLSTVSAQSGVVVNYTYNIMGERIKKTLGNQTYYYHYNFDGSLLWEFNYQNKSYTHYVYLQDAILAKLITTKKNK